MRSIFPYALLLICICGYTDARAQIDLTKYRIIFNGKEIKLNQVDSMQRLYPDVNMHADESTNPPTLYVTPYSKADYEKMAKVYDSTARSWSNRRLPAFKIRDINGHTVSPDNLNGKVVVFNFYFTTCEPCLREIGDLNKLVSKFKNKNVVFIAFGKEKLPVIKAFLAKRHFSYLQVPAAEALTTKTFGIDTWPTHIVADKNGRVQYFSQGLGKTTVGDITNKINELLQK